MTPLGPDPGLVPGDEREKMSPWKGPLRDNLSVLNRNNWGKADKVATETEKRATESFLSKYLDVRHISFMQGSSFHSLFVIFDEAQEFNEFQMRAFASRLGPKTKIVFMGNLKQIANHHICSTTSGLTHAVECYQDYGRSAHIVFTENHRDEAVTWLNDHW
jgi:PhoH-like ATPase